MKRAWMVAFLLLAVAARAAVPISLRVDELLADWRVEEAAVAAEAAVKDAPQDADALLAAARVAFYQSDYTRAKDLARRAAAGTSSDPKSVEMAQGMVQYLDERTPIWASFEETASEHFVIRVTPRDRILVPYAIDALEKSVVAMREELGFEPKQKVVVEFYPSRRSFIGASTLTREEVETSGTLAICHYNRIMMMSPAVLARGFEWLDALCHEYVHYSVYSLGGDAVPVWLHEGIAKHLEARWREPSPQPLDPRMGSVLSEGLAAGKWVTFAQMHPSMAKLPSAALVSMAFSEVATTVEMLRLRHGKDAIPRLIARVAASDGDLDAALTSAFSMTMVQLEEQGRAHAVALKLPRVPGLAFFDDESDEKPDWLEFKDEGEAPNDEEAEARKVEDRKAQDFTLLADRLKGRRFHEAALIEYDKALERLQQSEPLVINKKAHALLLAGRPEAAIEVLERSLRWAPGLAVSLDNLSEAHLALVQKSRDAAEADAHARRALELARESERINPFNVDTHVRLARLLDRSGDAAAAERARERIALLRQQD